MERHKAMVASAIVAVTLTAGAASYALANGALGGRHDNVGNLAPAIQISTDTGPSTDGATSNGAVNGSATNTERSGGERHHDDGNEHRGGDDD